MKESIEYVLKRLDQWYSDRFRKYYTDEVEEQITEHLSKKLNEVGESKVDLILTGLGFYNGMNKEALIEEAETYFSKTYDSIEELPPLPENINDTIKENYESLGKKLEKLKDFVNNVSQVANHNKKLSMNDINSAFLKTFENIQGYTDFCISYYDTITLITQEVLMDQGITQTDLSSISCFLEIFKQKIPYINEVLFSDLKD